MMNTLKRLWQNNKGFALFLLLMFTFRSAIADWNIVPTESMRPTIQVGDRIWVNKLAYDIQLPFFYVSLYRFADPKRGDIVVFESEVSDLRLVKRVAGIPGDQIAMKGNQLWLNGEALPYSVEQTSEAEAILRESLGSIKHEIRLDLNHPSPLSSFPPVTIPEDYYFVLGDNRDNSNDSRFISFIPRDEIIGRTSTVVMSHDFDNYYLPKKDRFFKKL
jgi:signal peptidase I